MIGAPDWLEQDVSRETLHKLTAFQDLLVKWTSKINLVAKSTVAEAADRHIWDSAQTYLPATGTWVDMGSGGGLPGVVIAILAQGCGHPTNVVLIESDKRKATFLRACARDLQLPMAVIAQRVEQASAQNADFISARALADLDTLLALAQPHLAENGTCVFMKGAQWKSEILNARKNWRFDCDATPSKTNPKAAILRIRDIKRA